MCACIELLFKEILCIKRGHKKAQNIKVSNERWGKIKVKQSKSKINSFLKDTSLIFNNFIKNAVQWQKLMLPVGKNKKSYPNSENLC